MEMDGDDGGSAVRPHPPANGGWGFDGDGTQPKIKIPTQEKHYKDDDDDVIPIIPDLEDDADEDITLQVAAPPAPAPFQPQKVPNLRELDAEIRTNDMGPMSTIDEGVDLSILLQCLVPQKNLIEEDIMWDHEQLFHEIASHVTKERETADDQASPGSPLAPARMA